MQRYEKSYQYLCKLMWKDPDVHKSGADIILEDVRKEFPLIAEFQLISIQQHLKISFVTEYAKKWQEVHRMKAKFIRKNSASFLLKTYTFIFPTEAPPEKINKNIGGRPRKYLKELSQRGQNKRHEEILSQFSIDELKRDLVRRERKVSESVKDQKPDDDVLHEDVNHNCVIYQQPLALLHDARLSKLDYNKMRQHMKVINNVQVLPGYDKITEIKRNCYPAEGDFKIDCNGASVKLLSLIEITLSRILMTVEKESLQKVSGQQLTLLGKYGMDGASGQQTTRQRWSSDSNDESQTDSAVFLVTFCPLQLKAGSIVIWQNKRPNSPFYTRTTEFRYVKESNELISDTYYQYNSILKSKKFINVNFEQEKWQVDLDIKCTMIDGKICNCLAGQDSTRSCYLCRVGQGSINNIADVIKRKVEKKEHLEFGLASLHGWIKCMEYILHISYNIECTHNVEELKAKGLSKIEIDRIKEENKEKVSARKQKIRDELKKRLSITVDTVKQGVGNTNTGNVARAFFKNSKVVAEITEVDVQLITRIHAILQVTVTCQYTANIRKFRQYCHETAEMFVERYGWYTMPPGVHKLLIHSSDIIQALGSQYPCGWFSEEPQEALNKFFRDARKHRSRMSDRKKTNEDILHYLLEISDPKITSLRIASKSDDQELTTEAKDLLKIKKQ